MFVYLSAILVLTVIFLSMGVGSISSALKRLNSLSNIELVDERLAAEGTGQTQITISPAELSASINESRRNILYLILANIVFVAVIALGTILVTQVARELHSKEMKSEFFSAFSHDLKTPLTIIQLYSETLMRSKNLPARTRATYYRIIHRESQSLGQMIERVLTMSRFEQGAGSCRLIEGDFLKEIGRRVRNYAQHLRLRGFQVVVSLPPELPPVRFDVEAAGQAAMNLMDNARKYSGDAKYIRATLYQRGNEIVFEVQDRGPGISKEEQAKLFVGFYRGDNSTARKGFGMGLYLVRQIMRAHRGRVELESEIGKGSTFRLVFPVASESKSWVFRHPLAAMQRVWNSSRAGIPFLHPMKRLGRGKLFHTH